MVRSIVIGQLFEREILVSGKSQVDRCRHLGSAVCGVTTCLLIAEFVAFGGAVQQQQQQQLKTHFTIVERSFIKAPFYDGWSSQ